MTTRNQHEILRIHPVAGERWRFHVRSQSAPGTVHLVDLTSNYGHGECSCLYYAKQAGGALVNRARQVRSDCALVGEEITEEESYHRAALPFRKGVRGCTECRHIAAAREWVWRIKMRPLLHAWRDGAPADWQPSLRSFFDWD